MLSGPDRPLLNSAQPEKNRKNLNFICLSLIKGRTKVTTTAKHNSCTVSYCSLQFELW